MSEFCGVQRAVFQANQRMSQSHEHPSGCAPFTPAQAHQLYAAALRQRAFDVARGITAPQPAESDSYVEDSYAGVPPLDPASTVTPYSVAAGLLRQVG